MGYTALNVTAPHATAYDASYPTRSTENYSHALHDILQDMEDAAGIWYLRDNYPTGAELATYTGYIHDMIEDVFDYANGAITTYRATGTPTLSKPTKSLITAAINIYEPVNNLLLEVYTDCMKMCYKIYYMWKTEDDPLLLKEKLQELLISWPLTDTEIILNEEGGQSMHIVPAWKNVDL